MSVPAISVTIFTLNCCAPLLPCPSIDMRGPIIMCCLSYCIDGWHYNRAACCAHAIAPAVMLLMCACACVLQMGGIKSVQLVVYMGWRQP